MDGLDERPDLSFPASRRQHVSKRSSTSFTLPCGTRPWSAHHRNTWTVDQIMIKLAVLLSTRVQPVVRLTETLGLCISCLTPKNSVLVIRSRRRNPTRAPPASFSPVRASSSNLRLWHDRHTLVPDTQIHRESLSHPSSLPYLSKHIHNSINITSRPKAGTHITKASP